MRETEHLARFNSILVLLFILLLQCSMYAQIYPDTSVDFLMKKGINEIINQKYDSAKADFTVLNEKFPAIPLGRIYLAATEIARSYDQAVEFNSALIDSNLNAAENQAEALIGKDGKNPWNYYFSALSQGYFAYFNALKKNWFGALNYGLKSISSFEKCLNINPRFYDGYTAIGSFKYWKSRKTEFLAWLPFVDNEEQKGINDLLISTNHFSYNEYLAFNSLIWIYIDQKKFGSAVKLAEKVLAKYPASRSFKWGLARAYEGIDLKKSVNVYNQLLNSYKNIPNSNHYSEIVLMHILAQQYYKLGDNEKALNLCNQILSFNNLSDYVRDRLKRRLERVKELKSKLSK